MIDEGLIGRVKITVLDTHHVTGECVFALSNNDVTESDVKLHQEVSFLLKTKETIVSIACTEKVQSTVEGESEEVIYHSFRHSLQVDCKDLPEDMEFQDEREAVTEVVDASAEIAATYMAGKKSPIIRLKVHLDLFEAVLQSKEAEFEQVLQQLEILRGKVKEASKKQASPPPAAASKQKKQSKKRNVQFNEEPTEVVKTGILGSMLPILIQNAALVAGIAVEHRAVFMFGITTLGIYFFGEHASI